MGNHTRLHTNSLALSPNMLEFELSFTTMVCDESESLTTMVARLLFESEATFRDLQEVCPLSEMVLTMSEMVC